MPNKKKKEKRLFSYIYSSVPEYVTHKIGKYKEKEKGTAEFSYITKKTFKILNKKVEEHNSNLEEGEQPRILTVEGFTKIKKCKKDKDALIRVDYEREVTLESGETERVIDNYEFDVRKKKAFASKPKGYLYTKNENQFIAITRSYIIPLILVLVTVLGVGGYGMYRYIVPINDRPAAKDFVPDIDGNINQKQDVPEGGIKQEGIKVEGFSLWTVEAGRKDNISVPLRNPAGNPCYFTFEVILNNKDKTKETLYKSKMVPPGEGIGKISFTRPLEKGKYDVTIMIYTNELGTGAEMNSAQLDVEVTAS